MSEIFDKQGRSIAGGIGSRIRNVGAPVGNRNAAKPEDEKRTSRIFVNVTSTEKAGCVKQAHGNLNAWCRSKLGLPE